MKMTKQRKKLHKQWLLIMKEKEAKREIKPKSQKKKKDFRDEK